MKTIYISIILIFLISHFAFSQNLEYKEDFQKGNGFKDIVQEGKVLLVFESDLNLTFESSMEILPPQSKNGNLYMIQVKERKCVLTIQNSSTGEKLVIPFGQLSENTLPPLKEGEVKYFIIKEADKLNVINETEDKKKEGIVDNQMLYEREALFIFNMDPASIDLEFLSTKNITKVRKEGNTYKLFLLPEPQTITVTHKESGAFFNISTQEISVKEVRYYIVILPDYLRKKTPEKIESELNENNETFIDSRDDKPYKYVKIGNQNWMAENLNYTTSSGSWCYDNNTSNCIKYGRLYNWETAETACPSGWHLPSDAEWTNLHDFVGSDVGKKLKSTAGWNKRGNGSDDYSFTALPGGNRASDGTFNDVGDLSFFWSSTGNATDALNRIMNYNFSTLLRNGSKKMLGFSVRCVKDN